jgi:5-methyltetrahydropteroyltriglutamate--homocysteine methyltransferase
MQRSEERILTTHVGSLPREPALRDLLVRRERDPQADLPELPEAAERGVMRAVEKQLEAGIDVGNNGEQPRVGFSTYVASRMRGFGGESARPPSLDADLFPDHAAMLNDRRKFASMINVTPRAVG